MKEEIKKPSLDLEVKAEVVGISTIENNINEVKNVAIQLKKYYENIIFDDEDMKVAKDEKTQINKFKAKVNEFKKQIIDEFNKPIKNFSDTAKETIALLDEAYNTINIQVKKYEDGKRKEKELKIKRYFEEYKESRLLGFTTYEQAGINVTLTASEKSLKAKAKEFIDKVCDEVELINMQNNKEEILAEYMKHLNVAKAIKDVKDRHFIIETIEKSNQEIEKHEEIEKKVIDKVNKVIQAPVEEEKVYKVSFTVKATKNKLSELKQFLAKGEYDYE